MPGKGFVKISEIKKNRTKVYLNRNKCQYLKNYFMPKLQVCLFFFKLPHQSATVSSIKKNEKEEIR